MSNLIVERQGDSVVVRSQRSLFGLGLLWTVGLVATAVINVKGGETPWDTTDVVGTIFLSLVGVWMMFPRTMVTSFDPVKQEAIQDNVIGPGWRWRSRSHSFSEIAGVGIDRNWDSEDGQPRKDGQFSCSLIITLKDDRKVGLIHESASQSDCREAAETICAATGLARLDVALAASGADAHSANADQ